MIIKSAKHTMHVLIGLFFACSIIGLVMVSIFAWKLSKGTINLGVAIPYIQQGFQRQSPDQEILISKLYMQWRGFENPLALNAKKIVLSNQQGPYLYAPEIIANISLRSALLGILRFEDIIIDEITLSVTKTKDGEFKITGQPKNIEPKQINTAIPAKITLNNLIQDLPNIDHLKIRDARVIYNDEMNKKKSVFDQVTIDTYTKTPNGKKSLFGYINVPIDNETTRFNFLSQSDPFILDIDGEINDVTMGKILSFLPIQIPDFVSINGSLSGQYKIQLDNTWRISRLWANINSPQIDIAINHQNFEEKFNLSSTSVILSHDIKTNMATIESMDTRLNDVANMSLSGTIDSWDDINNMAGNTNLKISDLPHDFIKKYWPKTYSNNGAYKWLVKNMSDGEFSNIIMTSIFDMSATSPDKDRPLPPFIKSIKADFSYNGINVQYNPTLKPAKNVSGTGKFDDIALSLDILDASVGDMKVSDATLFFDNLVTKNKGTVDLKLPVTSPLQGVMDYISDHPINAFEKTTFKPVDTKGDVTATVNLKIPLIKDTPISDIDMNIDGILNNASVPNAVKDLTISGGPYNFNVTMDKLKIDGAGFIAEQPLEFTWHQKLPKSTTSDMTYKSKITALVTVNDKIKQTFIPQISDRILKNTAVEMEYLTNKSNITSVDLNLDLGQSHLKIPEIGLNKTSGVPLKGSLNVLLNKDKKISSINDLTLNGSGIALKNGSVSFHNNGDIKSAELNNIIYGSNKLTIAMGSEENLLKTTLTGSYFDARPLLEGRKNNKKNGNTKRPIEIGMTINEMSVGDGETLKQPKIYTKINETGDVEQFEIDSFLGKNGTNGQLSVRYTPTSTDGLSLRVESNNAGETLRTFGLFSHIHGGTLQIAGQPVIGGRFGDVAGKARIDNFSVSNAPNILRLLNALSFQNFLQSGALDFTRLESNFKWELGDGGDIYTISNGTTTGTSVAFTFDGIIDTINENINITGTAAPLSELNNIIGSIPLIGNLITGGDALLAATYSITGSPDNTKVNVNPLSVLAPGIIRKMLFESTPTAAPNDNKNDTDRDRKPLN